MYYHNLQEKKMSGRRKIGKYRPGKNIYIPKEAGHIWEKALEKCEKENTSLGQIFVESFCEKYGVELPKVPSWYDNE